MPKRRMQLLVSAENASEAFDALQGGADLIDAKDAGAGALGAVTPGVLAEIHSTIGGLRPVTAALGNAADETAIERIAYRFAAGGAAFVKVGFLGITTTKRIRSLTDAAVRGARQGSPTTGVVPVAYADAEHVAILSPSTLAAVAADAGAQGLLIDTADKNGPGLRRLVGPVMLAAWVADAHDRGLFVALAGKLTARDFGFVHTAGADIVGVRGAACSGGRNGSVSVDRVRVLLERCRVREAVACSDRE